MGRKKRTRKRAFSLLGLQQQQQQQQQRQQQQHPSAKSINVFL